MIEAKLKALTVLRSIQDDGPTKLSSGICWNVGLLQEEAMLSPTGPYSVALALAKAWPGGDSTPWPVAGEVEPLGDDDYDAWDVSTKHGKRRRALLAWMIDTLAKELRHVNMA